MNETGRAESNELWGSARSRGCKTRADACVASWMNMRIRLRTYAMLVFVLALVLGSTLFVQRRKTSFLQMRKYHWMAAVELGFIADWTRAGRSRDFFSEGNIENIARRSQIGRDRLTDRDLMLMLEKASAYHLKLSHKYDVAWKHPWLPIHPDPPAPVLAFPDVPAVEDDLETLTK